MVPGLRNIEDDTVKLLFENWREYLNEDADIMDEWMVWARERAIHTIGWVAGTAANKTSTIDLIPDLFQTLSGESSWPGMARHLKHGLADDLYNGLELEAYPPVPESLMKKVTDAMKRPWNWDFATGQERLWAEQVLDPLYEQIIAELEDFGKTLEKIWADPEGAQFKEKIMERTVEDWRAAKALAESIV